MRWFTKSAFAALVSLSLADGDQVQAQAITRTADAVRENTAVESNFDRLRSAAYASYTRHEYALQPDGNLRGTARNVDSAGGLTPSRVKLFFVRHGEIVSQATPDAEGTFQASGLSPGYYSVISYGQGGLSSAGVRVVPAPEKSEAPKASSIGRERTLADVDGSSADVLHLNPIATIDVAPAFGLQRMMNGTPAPVPTASLPAPQAAVVPASAKSAVAAFDEPSMSDDMLIDAYERNAYRLGMDGMLHGQLRGFDASGNLVPATLTPMFFLRGGRVVAQSRSDETGRYQVAGLTPGYYSFVVAGQNRFGATAVTILPAVPAEEMPVPKTKSIGNIRPVSLAMQPPGGGGGPSTGGGDNNDANAATGQGGAGGGFPGGGGPGGGPGGGGPGGGAGGGGGGFGGFGGALAGLGAGIGAAAAASSNNDNGGGSSGSSANTGNN